MLGSSGSVIPKFKEQIAKGGPVTVPHPDTIRYFMTIPEAARLVLQAAAIGESGQVLVLDMGEPVRIVDLARDLIRMAGHMPDEITIEFTGLRAGEKLFEELLVGAMPTTRCRRRCRGCAWRGWQRARTALDGWTNCWRGWRRRRMPANRRQTPPCGRGCVPS